MFQHLLDSWMSVDFLGTPLNIDWPMGSHATARRRPKQKLGRKPWRCRGGFRGLGANKWRIWGYEIWWRFWRWATPTPPLLICDDLWCFPLGILLSLTEWLCFLGFCAQLRVQWQWMEVQQQSSAWILRGCLTRNDEWIQFGQSSRVETLQPCHFGFYFLKIVKTFLYLT